MNPPLVSIIIPCFRAERWIGETLESIRAQTYRPIEVIVCDGGSSDGTSDIVKQFGDLVTHFLSEPDQGPADALNKGLRLINGDVIGYINADDLLKPNAVSKAIDTLGGIDGPALVFRDIEFIDENGAPTVGYGGKLRFYCPGPYEQSAHRIGCMVVPQQGSFWNRAANDLVGDFNIDIKTAFDGHWFARASVGAVKLIYRPGIAASFRVHSNAISHGFREKEAWTKGHEQVNEVWMGAGIEPIFAWHSEVTCLKRYALRAYCHLRLFFER